MLIVNITIQTIRKADEATEAEHARVLFTGRQGKRSKGSNVSSAFSVVPPDKTRACVLFSHRSVCLLERIYERHVSSYKLTLIASLSSITKLCGKLSVRSMDLYLARYRRVTLE